MPLTIVHPKSYQDIQIHLSHTGETILKYYSDNISAPTKVKTRHGNILDVSLEFKGPRGSMVYEVTPNSRQLDWVLIKSEEDNELVETSEGIRRSFEDRLNVREEVDICVLGNTSPTRRFRFIAEGGDYKKAENNPPPNENYPEYIKIILNRETPLQPRYLWELTDYILRG